MESWGTKWLDKRGVQKDILQILKEQGINNVRLRVWVNPSGGWCGKADVVKMAKRAHAKGMGIEVCSILHAKPTRVELITSHV